MLNLRVEVRIYYEELISLLSRSRRDLITSHRKSLWHRCHLRLRTRRATMMLCCSTMPYCDCVEAAEEFVNWPGLRTSATDKVEAFQKPCQEKNAI